VKLKIPVQTQHMKMIPPTMKTQILHQVEKKEATETTQTETQKEEYTKNTNEILELKIMETHQITLHKEVEKAKVTTKEEITTVIKNTTITTTKMEDQIIILLIKNLVTRKLMNTRNHLIKLKLTQMKKIGKKKISLPPKDTRMKTEDVTLTKGSSFENFYLKKELLMAIYEKGFERPSPIQEATIPIILLGKSLLARAKKWNWKNGIFLYTFN